MTEDESRLDRLVDMVTEGGKTRAILPDLVRQLCAREMAVHKRDAEVVKRVKRKLHQVGGAYFPSKPRYARWLADLEAAMPDNRLTVLQDLFKHHSSMKERASGLEPYYRALFADVGQPCTVLDLACGFNPLGRPWMPIAPRRYVCCDIYADMLDFVRAAAALIDHPVDAFQHDLTQPLPEIEADVVLLLKTLPCLEQIDPDASGRLLDSLTAPHVIVTYPLRSLGGQEKGMARTYSDRFRRLADRLDYDVTEFSLPFELGFRLSR